MTTSLAEQLKRLAVPQVATIITDRRRTPSILFDPKEAAAKDRSTIYELAISGLHELIILNGSFVQFRDTILFDESSKDIQRSVENDNKNEELNNLIQRFLHYISPYFLLQPAHKCIEWLIRRFRIQDYNTDDFVCLLLIYHETKVAARCIQTIDLKNSYNNNWSWLLPVKKSGNPLSKQTLINHSVSQPSFLGLIGKFTCAAVKSLGKHSGSLQVVINFYCQLAIATMNVKLNDNILNNVQDSIYYGFKSTVADFKAMSYILTCHLVTKQQIGQKLCEKLSDMAIEANIRNNFDQETATVLLLIFQYQDSFNITGFILDYVFKKDTFFSNLNVLYCNGYDILLLLRPLLKLLLEGIQQNKSSFVMYQQCFENFMDFLHLNKDEAQEVITCIFENFPLNTDNDHKISQWYITLLRNLEKRHPEEFSNVVKCAITNEEACNSKSIKNLLDYFFNFSLDQRNLGMFVQLFETNLQVCPDIIQNVVERFDMLAQNEEGRTLLRLFILKRLEDDDSFIIEKTLQLGVENLISLLTADILVDKLTKILVKGIENPANMENCVARVIEILIAKEIMDSRQLLIALLLYPYSENLSKNPRLEKSVNKIMHNLNPTYTDLKNTMIEFENCKAYAESNVNYLIHYLQENSPSTEGIPIFHMIKKLIKLIDEEKQTEMLIKSIRGLISNTDITKIDISIRIYYEIVESVADNSFFCETLHLLLTKLTKNNGNNIEFLSQFCITTHHSAKAVLITLKLIAAIIKKGSTKVTDRSVIRILYTLIAPEMNIRQAAFDVVESLAAKSGVFEPLLQSLIRTKEELLLDHHQLPLALYTCFTIDSGKIEKGIQKILNIIVNYASANTTSLNEKALIMHLLMHIRSIDLFERLVPIGFEILLNKADGEHFFKTEESIVLKYLVNFIGKEFAIATNKNEIFQDFLITLLKTTKMIKPSTNEKPVPLVAATIILITPDTFKSFTYDLKVNIVENIVNAATVSDNASIHHALHHMFKSTSISYEIVESILEKMKNLQGQKKARGKPRHLSKLSDSSHILQVVNSIRWKMGVTTLELYQSKLHVDKPFEMIPILFEILQVLVDFDEHPTVEYTKQLVLSSILLGCQKQMLQATLHKVLKVDLVMQCIRGTQNSQTHHHALLLLAHIAAVNPDQVLHEVISIFTFMGSSVARYDDDYSFQIMSQIIQNILPKIVQKQHDNEKQVVSVLRIFSDIILDVPTHRQLTVYKKLVETLGATESLWMFLSLLLQTHVNSDKQKSSKIKKNTNEYDHVDLSPRAEIALLISKEFSAEVLLETCTKLIHHISNLPQNSEHTKHTHVFDVKTHTAKELRFYRYVSLQFVRCLLSSSIEMNNTEAMQPFCSNLIADTLRAIPGLVKASTGQDHLTYWRVILSQHYDILELAIGLLTPDLFLKTVYELILNHKFYVVRIKVIEMLSDKLQHHEAYFEGCNGKNIIVLLDPLKDILDTIGNETSNSKGYTHSEWWTMQQLTLTCMKLLSRSYTISFKDEFLDILNFLVSKIQFINKMTDKLLGSYILCLAEVCACLKAHSITSLHAIVPGILAVVNMQNAAPSNLLLNSAVTAIQRIAEALPNFLSPYIVTILISFSKLFTTALEAREQRDESASLLTKLKSLWHTIALSIPTRVIIPAINNSYIEIISEGRFNAVGPIMELITECFNLKSTQDLQNLQSVISEFILRALRFRSDHLEKCSLDYLSNIEQYGIIAINSLVLRLSESAFRPIFFKIHNWAFDEVCTDPKQKLITYFKLTNSLVETIKSLFLLFANDLVKPAAELLIVVNDSKAPQLCLNNTEDNTLLLKYILKTLYNIAICDHDKFVNEHRFTQLMEPLVDQLENSVMKGNKDLKRILKDTITALGIAVADVILWKQLNLHLLAKTRFDDPEIKILALQTSVALAQKLGHDYIQLLPETIPFFAELMESGVYEVEQAVQNSLQDLEVAVGENIRKYF